MNNPETANSNWYVFYTCPRAEKIAYRELLIRGYEAFLPTTRTLKTWKNRKKVWVDQVLFPSYVFINTIHSELFDIKRIPKIVTYIQTAGKPSIIHQKEIQCIKRILNLDLDITVETNFTEGDIVRIAHGPLTGHVGILQQRKGKTRFGIHLKDINHTVFIDVCNSMLEKVKYTHRGLIE